MTAPKGVAIFLDTGFISSAGRNDPPGIKIFADGRNAWGAAFGGCAALSKFSEKGLTGLVSYGKLRVIKRLVEPNL